MGRTISDARLASWARRLGGTERAHDGVPGWITANAIRMEGRIGMTQLSNFGVMTADDPDFFEAALLRRPIGSTMLYSTLQTPHTVSYDRAESRGDDIVIVGAMHLGVQRMSTPSRTQVLGVGRMGFMSSIGTSSMEHVGLCDTTGVVVPAAALPGHRQVLARGAEIFPDTPLTRAADAAFSRMLAEWLRDPDQSAGAVAGTEAALIALVRSLFRQFSESSDDASVRRAEAIRLIDARHRDAGFGIDQIARELHVSRRQLFRLFAGTDESLAERLLRRRLATAREELVAVPRRDLDTVASRSGFLDAAALRAQFARHVGISPTAFRVSARAPRLATGMLLSDEQEQRSS